MVVIVEIGLYYFEFCLFFRMFLIFVVFVIKIVLSVDIVFNFFDFFFFDFRFVGVGICKEVLGLMSILVLV